VSLTARIGGTILRLASAAVTFPGAALRDQASA
jgi:hypothetical protein